MSRSRVRKRGGSASEFATEGADLASDTGGEVDFDEGLPATSGHKRIRLNKRAGRPGYSIGADIGDDHSMGEAGDRYRGSDTDFDSGLRPAREIVVKSEDDGEDADGDDGEDGDEDGDDGETEDDPERETVDKGKVQKPSHPAKKPSVKAAPHVHTYKDGGQTFTTSSDDADPGKAHTHTVAIRGKTVTTSSDPGGPGHEHSVKVGGKVLTSSDPKAPPTKRDKADDNDDPPTVVEVVDLIKADKSDIQTLIFDKGRFKTAADAKIWAKENGFKSNKVDATDKTFRLRQKDPGLFQDGSFRTINLTEGVKAVIGRPKKVGIKDKTKKSESGDLPEVLTWAAVRSGEMPEKGSGLPHSLEQDVPPAFRYWKCAGTEALAVRDALVESRLFREDTIKMVDKVPRRAVVETIQKLFLSPEYNDVDPVEVPEHRDPVTKAADLLDMGGDTILFGEKMTEAIGIEVLLEKVGKLESDWVIAAKDTPEVRKAIAGPCFRLWSSEDIVFVTNAALADQESVEWVQRSRAEEVIKFAFHEGREIRIFKAKKDSEERTIFGIVLEPDERDSQDDTISKEEIKNAAHKFMEDFGNLGLQHQEIVNGRLKLLETFLAPVDFKAENGELVKAGTWLMKERVVDDEMWAAVKSGKLTGFSIGGSAIRRPA